MPGVRSATLGIWADVGSAAEERERRGISHLVEHMLFKGTERRTARAIAEAMDGVGGNLNAFTDKETTCYYAKVIDHHVPLAIDVLTDMFLNSTFDPQELRKEQNVVLEEIKMYDDSPDEMIHDLFIRTMWSGSNLGDPTIGYADTVNALTRDALRGHMARALRSEHGRLRGGRQHRARSDRRTVCTRRSLGSRGAANRPFRSTRTSRRRPSSSTRTPSKPTSCWERAASRCATSGATRCRCSTRSSAAGCRAGSSRKCARSAAWRIASTRSSRRTVRPDCSRSTPARRR